MWCDAGCCSWTDRLELVTGSRNKQEDSCESVSFHMLSPTLLLNESQMVSYCELSTGRMHGAGHFKIDRDIINHL